MNIREILDDASIEYLGAGQHHHARPGWIQLKHCPFCSSDNYHLGFNLAGGFFACWRCGGHSVQKVLVGLGLDERQARELAATVTLDQPIPRERTKISLKIPRGIGPLQESHERYLWDRGFDPEEILRLWKVQGIGIAVRLSWRLFIPIIYQGEIVSWTTRSIGHGVIQRYISASSEEEKINHKHLIYGEDYCCHSIIVVEGPTDAWRVGPGAGALFGTGFTTAQVKRIVSHPYRCIVFDSSMEAQARAEELADQLSAFPGQTEVICLDAEDPGSATDKEIRRLRRAVRL